MSATPRKPWLLVERIGMKTILIIDDEEPLRELVREVLTPAAST
jgi:hypothetical protein